MFRFKFRKAYLFTAFNVPKEVFISTIKIVKGALSGYVIGCSAAFVTAVLVDRSAGTASGRSLLGGCFRSAGSAVSRRSASVLSWNTPPPRSPISSAAPCWRLTAPCW